MQSIYKKGLTGIAIVSLLITAYFLIGVLMFTNSQYNNINTNNLASAAVLIKNFTPADIFKDENHKANWVLHIENSDTVFPYRITLINRIGQVIYDTDTDTAVIENHLDRPEFQSAVKNGTGTARRQSATLGQHFIYAAIAIHDSDGQFAGVLRLSSLVPGFFARLLKSAFVFLFLGVLIIISACFFLYRFSRLLSIRAEKKLALDLQERTAQLRLKFEEAEAENLHREVLLNTMFDGIMTLDNNCNIVLANPRLYSLFGIDREKDIRSMSLLEFSHSAELEDAAKLVIKEGVQKEFSIKRYMSGSEQYFQVFAAPLEGISNRGAVMALGDISRLVKLEKVRRDFAANVSHELRTPIQVIKGFTENLLDSSLDDKDEIRHFTGIISKNILTMENITNDLLTLVGLEDQDIRPEMVETSLVPLIEEAIMMLESAAKKKSISINIFCSQEISVKLYDSLFIQAMVNLLDNSIKYSKDGFPVNIFISRENKELVIEVKDNGIGIPAEHIDRIFERFYRVDRSRSREAGGTGLGLSIVNHIVRLHGWKIEVESHAGEGSLFRLRLPV